jgi:hypothetical protein
MPDDAPDERYVVAQGDCISSVASAHGLNWQILWDHNPELQSSRKNPNALLPGDVILIPSVRVRYENCSTDQTHRFVLKGSTTKFRLILERFGQPLARKRWVLTVDGQRHSGTTNSKGLLEIVLAPEARSGHLVVPEEHLEYDLSFGYLDPSNTISGAQARLENLGLYYGAITGEMGDDTRDAILMFQTSQGIPATGELDDRTRTELEQCHDNMHSQSAPESYAPPAETPHDNDQPEEVAIDDDEDDRRFQQFAQMDEEEE